MGVVKGLPTRNPLTQDPSRRSASTETPRPNFTVMSGVSIPVLKTAAIPRELDLRKIFATVTGVVIVGLVEITRDKAIKVTKSKGHYFVGLMAQTAEQKYRYPL